MSEPKPEYNNNPKVHVAQGFVPHFGTWSTKWSTSMWEYMYRYLLLLTTFLEVREHPY